MKKTWIYGGIVGVLAAAVLSGCGDGTEGDALTKLSDVVEPVTLSAEVQGETSEIGRAHV